MRTFLTLSLLAIAACGGRGESEEPDQPDVVCTMEARSALLVTVLDAHTGVRVHGATVRATTVDHAENLAEFDGQYSGAHERAGTYTVVVSHPDYQQWQRAGIVVERDECHVISEQVEARLTRREPTGSG